MEALNLANRPHTRPVYEYELPEELRDKDEYVKRSIGLCKLMMSEEIAATERAAGNQARLAYTFVRFALAEIDGRKINKGEAEDETILERCDPQIRELMLTAYTDMSTASGTDTKKFLGSRKVKIG